MRDIMTDTSRTDIDTRKSDSFRWSHRHTRLLIQGSTISIVE